KHKIFTTEQVSFYLTTILKKYDPDAKITWEDTRIVNGHPVHAVEYSCLSNGVPNKQLVYIHSGSAGSIMVIATIENQSIKNLEDSMELLNGLEVSDQQMPSSANREILPKQGLLFLNSKIWVEYDPKKWKQAAKRVVTGAEIEASDIEDWLIGDFMFIHSSG